MGYVTQATQASQGLVGGLLRAANLYTKFEVSTDITGGVKFLNVSRVPDPTHAHLGDI